MSSAKIAIYPNSLILERGSSAFLRKKRKDKESTNWSGGTDSSRRQRLVSPDGDMARV
jgi:hypothetical protein